MQIQSAHQQSAAKQSGIQACSHGMVGACPQCMGSGGGSGGGVKRNTAGLMTWNQAWAVWNALQTNNARQSAYLKGTAINQARMQQDALASLQRMPLGNLLVRLMQAYLPIARGFTQATALAGRVVEQMVRGLENVARQLASALVDGNRIADKLASILGDGKKLLEDILHHNIETLKSIMARLNFAERLAQVNKMMENALRTLAAETAQWIHEAGEQVQALFEKLKRWFKKPPKDQSKNSKRNQPFSGLH